MNYDCPSLNDGVRFEHLVRMMENLRLPQTLKKPTDEIVPFFYDVKQLMHENPYHNFCHVTDVAQYMYTLILATHVAERLRPIELSATFLGAVCHDLDHPGLSNTFQISERTSLATKYEGESPLENHHLHMFRRLCEKHRILENLEIDDRRRINNVVSNMILATDMGKHGALMKSIKEKLEDEAYNPLHSEEGINLLLQIALKCADISNQARPWKVANQWNEAVYKEFYNEGDLDRNAGRNVPPLFDRYSNHVPKSTVGFIGWVVAPLYEIYVAIMKRCALCDEQIDARAVEECLVFLHKNKERYQKQADGELLDADEEDAELLSFSADLRSCLENRNVTSKLPGVNGALQSDAANRFLRKMQTTSMRWERHMT
eukprot:CAMPEP_0198649228 /NCGR_PEP_ID=MMETSP1467-20131203/4095_1 /TAXON_ID=1462469 /ORGANISM="unid. sp., Strain CCMP2135" /LENGTH=373 /DNA_ID=CAMNT_0044384995 /DNA_START=340 /DNA_END=1461 /DNA_ORIENTATION=-